jgi:hypothetical protein
MHAGKFSCRWQTGHLVRSMGNLPKETLSLVSESSDEVMANEAPLGHCLDERAKRCMKLRREQVPVPYVYGGSTERCRAYVA